MTKSNKSMKLLIVGIFWLVVALSWASLGHLWVTVACVALGLGFVAYSVSQLRKEREQQQHG